MYFLNNKRMFIILGVILVAISISSFLIGIRIVPLIIVEGVLLLSCVIGFFVSCLNKNSVYKRTYGIMSFVLVCFCVIYVLFIIITYPNYIPYCGKIFYSSICKEYVDDFLPKELPANAKGVYWRSFPGIFQIHPYYVLSFYTDEIFLKKELERMGNYDIYVPKEESYMEAYNIYSWGVLVEEYQGPYLSYDKIRQYYNQGSISRYTNKISPEKIPKTEYAHTIVYYTDDYSYIAYSFESGMIMYYYNGDMFAN